MATVFIGDQFDRLCAAMEVAFATPQSLEEFALRKLRLRLNRIVSLNHPMSYICTQFVDWIDSNDQCAAEVLDKLEAFHAHCTILVAICREIKGRPASVVVVQPVPANDMHDPADAQLVLNSRVFCNREVVRDEVKKMVNGTDTRALITRVLIINGRSKVGKSECLSYLAHLEHAGWNTIRIVSIDLSAENDPAMRPDHLARRLALNLDIADGPPSPRAEQSDPRWLGDLVTWLNNLLRKQNQPVWIVLDGFRHELVPQLTHDFIIQFAKRLSVAAPNVAHGSFRL